MRRRVAQRDEDRDRKDVTLIHPISARGMIAYGHDIVMAGLSYMIAIWLRLGGGYDGFDDLAIEGAVTMAAIGAVVFWVSGLYRGVWRFASMNDLIAITRAVTVTILLFLLAMFLWSRMDAVPRSVPFINWFVLMALLGGPRFIYRFWRDRRIDLSLPAKGERLPVLLIGASDGADQVLRGLRQAGAAYEPVGILAENRKSVGRTIRGVGVIGTVDDLEHVFADLKSRGETPRRLILTKDEIKGAPVRDLLERAAKLGITLARAPRPTDFRNADDDTIEIKAVAIEDLLGRPQTPLDRAAMEAMIRGRRVLVTGAGGSIGAELTRQIAAFEPAEISLVENSEYALYTIDREVGEMFPGLCRRAIIADVRDRDRILAVVTDLRPDLVFHAAALKHVPLVEDNAAEGVRTNVGGTINVADACSKTGVDTMVLISTDKAVNPTSIMGATKRAAEMYCQALDLEKAGGNCRFVTVRFGNVLGSTGSVVPLFQRQLERGGPLTVTHPDMTRYFMTIREAVELVLEASAIDIEETREEGRIFVLDMGEPVRIVDLARQMIRLSGKEPGVDIEITFTGIRQGEKLFEEIFHGSEALIHTAHAGLLLATPRKVTRTQFETSFAPLIAAAEKGDSDTVRRLIPDVIPEFIGQTQSPPAKAAQST